MLVNCQKVTDNITFLTNDCQPQHSFEIFLTGQPWWYSADKMKMQNSIEIKLKVSTRQKRARLAWISWSQSCGSRNSWHDLDWFLTSNWFEMWNMVKMTFNIYLNKYEKLVVVGVCNLTFLILDQNWDC